jgi:regulator of protease activity HflC (stomatin/prohibitin superfamily)
MGFISILVLFIALYLVVSLRVLKQYERGVVFLLGRFAGVRGPGLTLIFVPFQQMVRVSLRIVTMQIPSQKIITRDNVSIDIAAVAYYHITDPERAVIAIENVFNAINQISQTTVRNVVGRFSLDQLLARQHQRSDQERHRSAHRALGDAGISRGDQGHHAAREHAARDGQGGRSGARAPCQDRRSRG